ncbi:conserved hypothetical protein [Shewanella baltica OS185]|nr:conserved hypothetical protein [Shewanella baltica OS185]
MTWGFIGTIIGAATSISTTSITNWNTFRITENAKVQDREERARGFQRETLLELQVEIRKYILACSRAYRSSMKIYDLTCEWQEYIPENLDEKLFELNSKTSILIQRVANDALRSKLTELQTAAINCNRSKNECEARAHYVTYSGIYESVHEKLGQELRNLY